MIPEIIRHKFSFYRKWFQTLLVREFMNLPYKHQENFIILADKFLQDCKKIHSEHQEIKERTVTITINDIQNTENNTILGAYLENALSKTEVKIIAPLNSKFKKDQKVRHILYSLDGQVWHSSKEQLLTGRS